MLEAYQTSSIEWKPAPVLALATSPDGSQVAAAREDGSLEIWMVAPGSIGWHSILTVHGDAESRVSSMVWCRVGSRDRLLSSSIDGSVSEWDLFILRKKTVLESVGVSIWQMAVAPHRIHFSHVGSKRPWFDNDDLLDSPESSVEDETSETDDDSDLVKFHQQSSFDDARLALACDDGCVRMYEVSESEDLVYIKSLPRVSGRILSVTWNPDASVVYSGSSDGLIRCWDATSSREIYRITVGLGGLGSGPEFCIWSLLSLRSDALVSADSTGTVQFWDSKHGTLLQAHSFHKGDVNALAAAPSHDRVFSAGSDGQIVLYKLSKETTGSNHGKISNKEVMKWVYVGYVRAHTHDVRSLTVAVPVLREDSSANEKPKRIRRRKKPVNFSYHKWAHTGIPMLLSSGDDTKIFAYSVKDFSKFSPHDICPAPQRLPIQLVLTGIEQTCLLLVQSPYWLDILSVHTKCGDYHITGPVPAGGKASTKLLARVKSKASRKVICSSISASGEHFAYSDHMKPNLFELKRSKGTKNAWTVNKRLLPPRVPSANCMIFSVDSSCLIIAGHDRRIYVVDIMSLKVLQTYTPCHEGQEEGVSPDELPITKMFISSNGQWLAAVNSFGDIFIFGLKIQRQHWFISRLNGASITAGGFSPHKINMLVLTTSSNHVYVFDVETKELGDWSKRKEFTMPRRFQEFPGEVIGLSFPPSPSSSAVVIYSPRALCLVDFGMPVDQENDSSLLSGQDLALRKLQNPVFGKLKHSDITCEIDAKANHRKNFDFFAFRDPVLFIGHLSKNSIIIVDKPWREVVKTLEAPPVHRHIFGS